MAPEPAKPADLRHLAWFLPSWVLLSSVTGLLRSLDAFGKVWAASVPGDLVFCLATGLTGFAAVTLGRQRARWFAPLLALLGTPLAYMAAWAFTGPAGFGDAGRDMGWVFVIGWPGMLIMPALAWAALAVPLVRGQESPEVPSALQP